MFYPDVIVVSPLPMCYIGVVSALECEHIFYEFVFVYMWVKVYVFSYLILL
jgi:hypothetical protein